LLHAVGTGGACPTQATVGNIGLARFRRIIVFVADEGASAAAFFFESCTHRASPRLTGRLRGPEPAIYLSLSHGLETSNFGRPGAAAVGKFDLEPRFSAPSVWGARIFVDGAARGESLRNSRVVPGEPPGSAWTLHRPVKASPFPIACNGKLVMMAFNEGPITSHTVHPSAAARAEPMSTCRSGCSTAFLFRTDVRVSPAPPAECILRRPQADGDRLGVPSSEKVATNRRQRRCPWARTPQPRPPHMPPRIRKATKWFKGRFSDRLVGRPICGPGKRSGPIYSESDQRHVPPTFSLFVFFSQPHLSTPSRPWFRQ